MRSKKSQGISITTIIIAAVALVVLIVLIAVFSNKFSIWGKETGKTEEDIKSRVCLSQPGYCVDSGIECKDDYTLDGLQDWVDCHAGQACCVKIR